jgi:hypothetical protein
VLHTFTENDLAYYRETMGGIVAASHDCGLEVQIAPWGVCQMFGGEAESRFTSHRRDVGQVLDDGTPTPERLPQRPARARLRRTSGSTRRSTPAPTASSATSRTGAPRALRAVDRALGLSLRALPRALRRRAADRADAEVLAFRERCLVDFIGDFVAHVAAQGAQPPSACCRSPAASTGSATGRGSPSLPGCTPSAPIPYWKAFGEEAEAMVRRVRRRVVDLAREHDVAAAAVDPGLPARARGRRRHPRPRCASRARRASTTCGRGASRRAGT